MSIKLHIIGVYVHTHKYMMRNMWVLKEQKRKISESMFNEKPIFGNCS